MKGIICFYSGSGNTKLACRYIAKKCDGIDFDLFNIARDGIPDLGKYQFAGFATFTDFLGVPFLMSEFIVSLPVQKDMPAFVLNTYGYINGKTVIDLKKSAEYRGFSVMAGHSLHTPESYPPMIVRGKGNEQAPDEKELRLFDNFVARIDAICKAIAEGSTVPKDRVSIGIMDRLLPSFGRDKARRDMGEKFVDESRCRECGTCRKNCPYGAIELSPKPVFDMEKCRGCWACYNHCTQKAIYTKKFRDAGHYPAPGAALRDKLKV
jgi:ferredoxin